MLKVFNLNKYFNRRRPNQIHVLKDISIDFPQKGLVTILGASGSGKTTLLNVICGLDKTDSGVIEVDNISMEKYRFNKWDHIRNQYFGYIFQNYNLFMDKTVFDNVAISLRLLGITDENLIKEQTLYTLSCVGMEKYKNRLAGSLSGGEQQRVAIARALVKDAHIIIADEPTGNLDEKNTIAIMNIIKKISQTRLVILVTHDRNLAHFYSDQIIEIRDGSIINVTDVTENKELSLSDEKNIYLGDLEKHTVAEKDKLRISLYNNEEIDLDVKLVVDGKNLYLQATSEKFHVKFLDSSSEVKLIEGHRPVITKETLVLNDFNIKPLPYTYKRRKARIRFFDYIKMGLMKLANMGRFRKIMLVGFSAAAFILCLAISSFSKLNTINESDFLNEDRYLVEVDDRDHKTSEKLEYALSLLDRPEIKDIFSSSYRIYRMTIEKYFLGFYETYYHQENMVGSIVGQSYQDLNIIGGRLPENSREVVIDKMVFDTLIEQYAYRYYGTTTIEAFLKQKIKVDYGMESEVSFFTFDIVGIADNNNMSIYFDDFYARALRTQILSYRKLEDVNTTVETLADNEILVREGKAPIGTELVLENNQKFIVKGYFTPKDEDDNLAQYVITPNAFRKIEVAHSIESYDTYYVYSTDPQTTVENISTDKIIVDSVYELSYDQYRQNRIILLTVSSIFTVGVVFASLIYLYFLMRSSLISRINEIGIYRALGMTRFNVYLMFIAEILTLTTLVSIPGYLLAAYIIYKVNSVAGAFTIFEWNNLIFISGILIIYLLNFITGLFPVYRLLRNTPREIISKYDI